MLEKFILSHDYFSEVWKTLPLFEKWKIIEILSSKKGLIPYELITKMDSFDMKPEDEILFEMT